MTTFLDDLFGNVVDILLNQAGIAATADLIVRQNGYIPELDRESNEPPLIYTINVTPPDGVNFRDVTGATIVTKDMKVICQGTLCDANGTPHLDANGNGVVPQVDNQLRFNDRTFRIVSVTPYYSGQQIAAWEIQLKA